MPGALQLATPTTVFPASLSRTFTFAGSFPALSNIYNDGTVERAIIQDGVNAPRQLRVWTLSKRLSPADLATLLSFFEARNGGWQAFYFYDPYGALPGSPAGSNYDPTGVSTTGRATVRFVGNWQHRVTLGRCDVPSIVLQEVA